MPLYFKVSNYDEFVMAVQEIASAGYKCIAKPADGSGSRGVVLIEEDCNMDATYEYSIQFSRCGQLVVEEYMEGPEVSVETIALHGSVHVIQITDKLTTGAPYFVEMGHSQPSQLSDDIIEKIKEVAIAANKAIGIRSGPSHTEIKITKTGPKIVEIGARLGGDCIATHLVPLSTGVDMVESSIKIALGEIPELKQRWSKGSAIRYLETKTGIVKDITGIDVAEKMPGVIQVSIIHGIGTHVSEIRNSNDRAGFVIGQDVSPKQAVRNVEKALGKIEFILDEDEY